MKAVRILAAILAFVMLAALAGCAKTKPGQIEEIEEYTTTVRVLNSEGAELGVINASSTVTATNRGLFYAKGALSTAGADTEYRLFDPMTGEDKSLGRVGKLCYEAQYARTELDGRLYVIATTGDLMDSIDDKLWLIGFDPDGGKTETLLSEQAFPYAYMAAVNGKLLIIVHDGTDTLIDRLYQFDPADGSLEEKLTFRMNGHGESLRGVYGTEDGFRLLRLVYVGGKASNAMLDEYDNNFELRSETDITGLIRRAAGEHVTKSDVDNELMQLVSKFADAGEGWIYYENFSMTHCFINPETEEYVAYTDLLSSSIGSGVPAYCMLMGQQPGEGIAANTVYGFGSGALNELIKPGDGSKNLSYISRSLGGSLLAVLDPGQSEETVGYYFN